MSVREEIEKLVETLDKAVILKLAEEKDMDV